MSVPQVGFQKVDFQTGVAPQSPVGVLAIIAPANPSSAMPMNVATSYARDDLAYNDAGPSPLAEDISYTIQVGGKSVLAIRPTTATQATYGTINKTGTGTSAITAGTTHPADSYPVTVNFITGGTIGVAGITYQYSLDGVNFSAVQALGTANTLTIPNFSQGGSPGVSFALGAGTIVAGDSFTCQTSHAQSTDTDLPAALEALRITKSPWEGVLIDQDLQSGEVALIDTWLQGLEKVGKFRFFLANSRMKQAGETEAAFATAMQALVAAQTPTIRGCVGTDGAELTSTLTGLTLPRPTSVLLGARAMKIAIGTDPALIADGPLAGATIIDTDGNPTFHNEELYPNLDQLLLTALRTVANEDGVFINNANVFSTVGSDYVFLPHIRTMNRACEVAYGVLVKELGRGVGKKPADPVTGGVYILEEDALTIEGMVNTAIERELAGQVASFKFQLARNDDLSSNAGAILNSTLTLVALAYIKGIKVLAAFAKSIAAAA